MKKTVTISIDGLSAYGNSVGELKKILEEIPDGATFDLSKSEGDRPWESGTFSIDFNVKDKK